MTISARTPTGLAGASDTAGAIANITWTLPSGVTTNDMLVAWAAIKPYNSTPAGPGDGYTARSGGANGTTGNGADVGSVYVIAYTKVHDGSEANPQSTMAAFYTPAMTAMNAFTSTRGGATWTVESTNGSDTTLTGTSISITGGTTLGYRAGDIVLVGVGHKTDAGAVSAGTVAITGCTLGTVTQTLGTAVTNAGNDGGLTVWQATIATGTASAAPVFTGTAPTSGQSDAQAVFLLIREPQTVTGTVAGDVTVPDGTVTNGTKKTTGTVVGVAPATSGTVVGKKNGSGTVTGVAPTTSGTAVGTAARFGTVTGEATAPDGTVTGTKHEGGSDFTGTVTGEATASGTVVGAKATSGTVAGDLTASGTATGSEGSTTTVTGQATASGTVAGTKDTSGTATGAAEASGTVSGSTQRTGTVTGAATATGTVTGTADQPDKSGTVTGDVTATGTVVGTKSDPDAPIPAAPTGGKAPRYYPYLTPPVIERRSGRVSGTASTPTAHVYGRRGVVGRPSGTVTATCHIGIGVKAARSLRARDYIRPRITVRGEGVTSISTRELRLVKEQRDLAEALLMEGLRHG